MCPKCQEAAQAEVAQNECQAMTLKAKAHPSGTIQEEGIEVVKEPANPENWGS